MEIGKIIVFAGVILVILGLFISFVPGFGRLPGDILIKRENSVFYFPLVTSIIISIILSILLNIFLRK
ncbi:MAG TPA: DUF2905 domain-containing protein [Candidatus Levybacteria bacterium]|nr:DUF2905 domain-containing protein [Candidatus Levybacteria bacterium]